MVLKIAHAVVTNILTPNHYTHVVLALAAIYALYTYSQGRKTTRERDLHGRTIILTGAFTPIGLTLLDTLARRGAHIIALSETPIDSGLPHVLVPILRQTHNNELIYAEHVSFSSPSSIKKFCDGFVKTENQRVDAIIFGHEYAVRGGREAEKERQAASASTFLFVTLFLPLLLVAPAERDIRLITLVNPFYAAAAPRFTALPPTSSTAASPSSPITSKSRKPKAEGLLAAEGRRALRSIVLTRHLQRVLDALPNNKQVPRTDGPAVTVVSWKKQRSNIVAVSVSPGVSRADVVAPLLGAESIVRPRSWRGLFVYILFNPFIRILTKSPASALESVLHALFLPTPFKLAQSDAVERESTTNADGTPALGPRRTPDEIEVLKPGALYAECAVAPLRVPPAPPPPSTDGADAEKPKEKEGKEEEDDGELGGVALGQAVWEEYEGLLKEWERSAKDEEEREERLEKERAEIEKEVMEREERGRRRASTPPTVDPDATTSA